MVQHINCVSIDSLRGLKYPEPDGSLILKPLCWGEASGIDGSLEKSKNRTTPRV
jgi:hypothetical protein